MLLAIDVGNSNTVFALYGLPASSEAAANWRIVTLSGQTADEFGSTLRSLFALHGFSLEVVTGVAISSVVPTLERMLREVAELFFHLTPFFLEAGVDTGLPLLVDHPAEVGADRIVNCIAAFAKYGGPAIVVDMGTATTFDAISAQGEFLGGAIAPGLAISADALFSRAALLPRIEIKRPAKIIGTGTVDNLQIGLYYGYIGLVDGILERMIAELGPETKTVATGGLASLIAGGSKYLKAVDETLTLDGLRIVYHRNRPT